MIYSKNIDFFSYVCYNQGMGLTFRPANFTIILRMAEFYTDSLNSSRDINLFLGGFMSRGEPRRLSLGGKDMKVISLKSQCSPELNAKILRGVEALVCCYREILPNGWRCCVIMP